MLITCPVTLPSVSQLLKSNSPMWFSLGAVSYRFNFFKFLGFLKLRHQKKYSDCFIHLSRDRTLFPDGTLTRKEWNKNTTNLIYIPVKLPLCTTKVKENVISLIMFTRTHDSVHSSITDCISLLLQPLLTTIKLH